MNRTEILEFAEVQGYNPDRRDSDRWFLEVTDKNDRAYRGFGLHVLHDREHSTGDTLVLIHSRGRMTFRVDEIKNAGWYHVAPWTHAAERVA